MFFPVAVCYVWEWDRNEMGIAPWESHWNGNKIQTWEWEWERMGINCMHGNGLEWDVQNPFWTSLMQIAK